jgi:hypothetical protein
VKDSQLFDAYDTNENPRRLLLEGASGIGKTTFCRHLAYEWARGNLTFSEKFKIVFHIDVRMIHKKHKEIEDVILDQCLPFSYKKSKDEITSVLQTNQQQVLFIFDAIESQRQTQALSVVFGNRYPEAGVIATINKSFVTANLLQNFDTRLILAGQHHEDQVNIVRNYSRLVQRPIGVFQPLINRIYTEIQADEKAEDDKSSNASTRETSSENGETDDAKDEKVPNVDLENDDSFMLSLNPMVCLCMCLVCEYTRNDLPCFKTISNVMQEFVTALHQLYCERAGLTFQNNNLPQPVQDAFQILEGVAFNAAVGHVDIMSTESLQKQHKNKDFLRFGMLHVFLAGQRSLPIESCFFASSLLQDYLAARHLMNMEQEDVVEYMEQVLSDPNLHHVAVFYIGLQYHGERNEAMVEVFHRLAEQNQSLVRSVTMLDDSRPETRDPRPETHDTKPQSAKTTTSVMTTATMGSQMDAARISDLELCLECLHECQGQEDAVRSIAATLPTRLYTRKTAIPSYATAMGLCHVLQNPDTAISELDLHLNHMTHYHFHASKQLAQAIERSKRVETLRLRWTSDEMLSFFMAQIFGKNSTIHTLKIYDECRSKQDGITATVWSSIQSAGRGMRWLKTLAFTSCKNPQMITSIIRNIPSALQELDMNHCVIDSISALDLSKKIEDSSRLKKLTLQSVQLDKPGFLYICSGIRHSKTLVELNLSNAGLDQYHMKMLADALGFNKGIRRLDLSRNSLGGEGSELMAEALATNRSLQEVNVRDCGLDEEDKAAIRARKRHQTTVLGVNQRRPASTFYKRS